MPKTKKKKLPFVNLGIRSTPSEAALIDKGAALARQSRNMFVLSIALEHASRVALEAETSTPSPEKQRK